MLNLQHTLIILSLVTFSSFAADPSFEVASVKPSAPDAQPNSNFPLGPGDVYVQNGGLFSATGFPLSTYLFFAYKLNGNQAQIIGPQLPGWATSDRFDIQARAKGNPTKDEMRLLMRTLLAERFKLAVHNEPRETAVLAGVLAKSGKLGPQLEHHADGTPCPVEPSAAKNGDLPKLHSGIALPPLCNGIYPMPPSEPGRLRFAGRNVTIALIADTLSAGTNSGRELIGETGLTGTFDFSIEFVMERRGPTPPGAEAADQQGPTFQQALNDQLGIKLGSKKAPVTVLVIDHLERPTAN